MLAFLQVMFNAVLENACSELGARMSAMDSSSRNAGEVLDRLTLTYNRFDTLSRSSLTFLFANTHWRVVSQLVYAIQTMLYF